MHGWCPIRAGVKTALAAHHNAVALGSSPDRWTVRQPFANLRPRQKNVSLRYLEVVLRPSSSLPGKSGVHRAARALVRLISRAIPVVLVASCTTTSPHAGSGVQPDYAAFVPARTAVLPCRSWPDSLGLAALPARDPTGPASEEICRKFNEVVLEGFSGQPFMKGFAPRLVEQLVAKSPRPALLTEMQPLLARRPGDCSDCPSPAAYYVRSIAPRVEWRQWLSDFSQHVRGADALLLPFVVWTRDERTDDRGLKVARRSSAVSMLLIDTSSGGLIWAGARDATAANKSLVGDQVPNVLSAPPWETVMDRMFVASLWRDYPGRQQL